MKGLKFPGSEKGWFKKEQKSLNEKPLGSEYKCDGYTMVKDKTTGTLYERWKLKHVLIWEKYNGRSSEKLRSRARIDASAIVNSRQSVGIGAEKIG